MPEFEMPKNFDEIIEGTVAETGVYVMILQEHEVLENKAQTGDNIVLSFAITGTNTEADGIVLKSYMSLPNSADNERMTKNKQPMVDFKLGMIRQTVEALGGKISGSKFSIPDMAMCKAKIIKSKNQDSGRDFNQIEGNLMPYTPPKKKAS